MAAFPLPAYLKVLIRHWKLLSYTFFGGNVVRGLVHFFSVPLTFTLHWWPLAFLILSPPLPNFHVVLPTKKCLLFFHLSLQISVAFLSLSFADPPPTFSISPSLSCSIFQICGHDNYSKVNILDNTDTETISSFRFRLYLLFSCDASLRTADIFPVSRFSSAGGWNKSRNYCDAGGYAISRQNQLRLACGLPYILHWYACAADGRSLGRAGGRWVGRCTVRWLPNFLGSAII